MACLQELWHELLRDGAADIAPHAMHNDGIRLGDALHEFALAWQGKGHRGKGSIDVPRGQDAAVRINQPLRDATGGS